MIAIEIAVFVSIVSAALGILAGMVLHRTVAGRLWSRGEVAVWASGYAAGREDARRGWPDGGGARAAAGAWAMEGSEDPERN